MAINLRKLFLRKSPVSDVSTARRGFFSRASTRVDDDTAMKVAACYRAVTYISTQVAKLPWDVKDKSNNVIDDQVARLLSLAPNPETNSFMFRLYMLSQALLLGNAYAEIERDGIGRPIAIWPLPTRDVELIRSESGQLVYKVTGGKGPGENAYIPARDVYHIRNFHTKDGLTGQGLAAYAAETLAISLSADVMASGIFHNGGIPSGVISIKGTLSDEAFKRLEESWNEQNTGRKAGGTRILEEESKYTPMSIPPEALQFLESRKFGVLELARFFGLPPTKLFDTDAATYSNVENANLEVATDTLDSWIVNLEMEADVKILNNRYGGKFTEIDVYSITRADQTTRGGYYKTLMGLGAMTPNQVRMREGMPGYGPEGDKYYIATNNLTPADRVDDVIDAQIAPKDTKDVTPKKVSDDEAAQKQIENKINEATLTILTDLSK